MADVATVTSRVDRLRASLEEPLLVTNATNVLYLTGFKSSNVALLVEDQRVRLFTDFRYREAAAAVEDVEVVETERSVIAGIAKHVEGRIGFEATAMTYADWSRLAGTELELVPYEGLVERLRAVKEPDELEKIRAAAAIGDRVYAAMAEERFVGRTEKELAWQMEHLFHAEGADALSFELIVAGGATGALPHGRPTTRPVEPNTTVVIDAGCYVDGYASDCTRTFATGELPDELARALRDVPGGAACRARGDAAWSRGRRRRRGRARRDRRRRLGRQLRPRPRARRRVARPRGASTSGAGPRTSSSPATS